MSEKKYNIGITFSGGAARGYGHIGILKALEEKGIVPEIISGTSMGALVGVFYAAGYPPREIEKILVKKTISKLMSFSWKKTGLMKMDKLKGELGKYLPTDDFSALKKPFYLGLTNLNEPKKEFFNSGPLFDFLVATCSAPGVFAPKVIEGISYVDGGLMCNLPASAIRDQCKILIGCHVNFPGTKKKLKTRELPERIFELGIGQNVKPEMELCDYLIDPPGMQNYSLLDFSSRKELVKVGYEHTIKLIEEGTIPSQPPRRGGVGL